MSRLLALTALCGMCIVVVADKMGNCIFDFESFSAQEDSDDTAVDYSGQSLTTLTEGSKTYRYIVGPLRIKSMLDTSYYVHYIIAKFSWGTITADSRNACDFSANIYPKYFEPISAMHNDFPPHPNICDREAGTTLHYFPANKSEELTSPSVLNEGKYFYNVTFVKDSKNVGGMSGIFNVLNVN